MSPETRLVAEAKNATKRPSAVMSGLLAVNPRTPGSWLLPLACCSSPLMLTRSVVPAVRSRTKTSTFPLVSAETRLVAPDMKTTSRPFRLTVGLELGASPLRLVAAHADQLGEPVLAIVDEHVEVPVGISGDEVAGEGLEHDPTTVGADGSERAGRVGLLPGAAQADPLGPPRCEVAHEDVVDPVRVVGHQVGGR